MIEDLIHNSEESRTEILQILNALNDEEFTATPLSGGWSISQVINHLITAETGTIKYISKKKLGAENLKNAGVRSQFNAAALKLALKTNKRFKAPSVLSAPENTSKENCLTAWDQCRKSLYLLFTDLDKSLLTKEIFKHPIAGYLNASQTIHFITDHTDHHAKQINRILTSLSNEKN
jgi:uncharacterized damage-inducible protein DinB